VTRDVASVIATFSDARASGDESPDLGHGRP
jgi:hypothetical protein